MDLNTLISQYGYAALVIGSLAEGETVTLLGGVAAHQGLLKFPLVVLSVALGGMIGDQVLYLCGRRFGGKLLRRFSKHQDKIEAHHLSENSGTGNELCRKNGYIKGRYSFHRWYRSLGKVLQ